MTSFMVTEVGLYRRPQFNKATRGACGGGVGERAAVRVVKTKKSAMDYIQVLKEFSVACI